MSEAAARGERRPAGGPRSVLLVEACEDGTAGGSHQCLFDLATRLPADRYRPLVLFYQDNRFVPRLRAAGVETLTWDAQRAEELTAGRGGRAAQLRDAVGRIRRRARLLRERKIDLVHINNSPRLAVDDWIPAARLAGAAAVSHERGNYERPKRFVWRWSTNRLDAVVAISRHVAEGLRGGGVDPRRVRQIYDGVDAAGFAARPTKSPAAVRALLGVPDGAFLVAMVGHLRCWKGHDVLLDALGSLPADLRDAYRVAVVGGAPDSDRDYQERLAALVRRHDLQRTALFLGERDDVPDLMNAADVVVHASTVPEPLGLVVMEAMSLGKAVVASRLGGPAEVVEDGSGFLFDPAAPADLAALLERLRADAALRSAAGERARARVAAFSVERNVEEIARLYDEVLARRRRR